MGKTVLIFPGQGSQYVGMGAALAARYPEAGEVFRRADSLLGFSVSSLCFQGPVEQLNQTRYTQPAVFTTSVAVLAVLRKKGLTFQATAGHSLGEYAALVAAGVLDWTDGLCIVKRRAELMEEAFPGGAGGMAAVLGLNWEQVKEVCQEASATGLVEPANCNAPGQVIISGTRAGLEAASELARRAGAKRVLPLAVSGPFHSSLMAGVGERLLELFDSFTFRPPEVQLVANATGDYLTDPDEIKKMLAKQVQSPVLWEQSVRRLIGDGYDTFIEAGPGSVLSGLVKRIAPGMRLGQVQDPDTLEKVLAQQGRTV